VFTPPQLILIRQLYWPPQTSVSSISALCSVCRLHDERSGFTCNTKFSSLIEMDESSLGPVIVLRGTVIWYISVLRASFGFAACHLKTHSTTEITSTLRNGLFHITFLIILLILTLRLENLRNYISLVVLYACDT
jgi:hypothetical protein